MSVRIQRGQSTKRVAPNRLSRPGQGRRRAVTVPPASHANMPQVVLALRAEIERLINEIGRHVGEDGRLSLEGFSPAIGDLVIGGTVEIRRTGANPRLDLNRTDAGEWRFSVDTNGNLLIRDQTEGATVATFLDSNNTLQFATGLDRRVTTETTSTTLDPTDDVVLVDATSGAVTITLPAAADVTGEQFSIKKIDSSANAVTVDGNGSETIDDQTTQVLASQYDLITVVSDGSEWWIGV